MLEKCVVTDLELNCNQRLGYKKTKINYYAHVVHTTAKQVISRRRKNENVFKMSKDDKCTCKACKNTVSHRQICKFVGFLLPSSSSWLLKLPIIMFVTRFNCIWFLIMMTDCPYRGHCKRHMRNVFALCKALLRESMGTWLYHCIIHHRFNVLLTVVAVILISVTCSTIPFTRSCDIKIEVKKFTENYGLKRNQQFLRCLI